MTVRALITAAIVLVAAADVEAATGDRPVGVTRTLTDEQMVERFVPVARSYWPGSPCAGRESIEVRADHALDAAHGTGVADGEATLDGSCRVRMRSGRSPLAFCITLAHELGHLAGHGHTDSGIMSPDSERVGPCVAATRWEEFSDAWYRTLEEMPFGGRGWVVTRRSRPLRGGGAEYVAYRSGFLRRRVRVYPPSEAFPGGRVGAAIPVTGRRSVPAGRRRARAMPSARTPTLAPTGGDRGRPPTG